MGSVMQHDRLQSSVLIPRNRWGVGAKSVLKSHYVRLTWQRDSQGSAGGKWKTAAAAGAWATGKLSSEEKENLPNVLSGQQCPGKFINRTLGLKWVKCGGPDPSIFALRLAASINLRMHLQQWSSRGEKGGFIERKLQSAFRPGKMKSSPLARTAIVVSNCLGYFALTIDRNYAL